MSAEHYKNTCYVTTRSFFSILLRFAASLAYFSVTGIVMKIMGNDSIAMTVLVEGKDETALKA